MKKSFEAAIKLEDVIRAANKSLEQQQAASTVKKELSKERSDYIKKITSEAWVHAQS